MNPSGSNRLVPRIFRELSNTQFTSTTKLNRVVSFGESEEGSTREVGKFGNEGEEENKKFEEKSLGLDVWHILRRTQ